MSSHPFPVYRGSLCYNKDNVDDFQEQIIKRKNVLIIDYTVYTIFVIS